MLKYNCPYEKNFIYSWMIHSQTSDTCMGQSCGEITKKFLCCSLSDMKDDIQSWSDISPLQCPKPTSTTIIVVAFLSCFLIFAFLLFIISTVYFILKSKRSNGYKELN